ncbi:MAG: SgcJ/EcaC family oxidoreductase [Candidatus Sulfotelmatobacter sp.]
MIIKEKAMKTSQLYRADSAPQALKSALRGLMQRLGLTLLACTLVVGVTGSASAGEAQDEAAVRALGDNFAKGFVQKNAELRASLFTQDGTFVTPVGDFLQGRAAMVKDFGPEAQQAVTATTQAAFSNYRVRFINPDVAVVDALLTVHNVNGPDGMIIPVIPIKFFYVAARHGDQWLIEDGRAHFAPAPANSMTDHAMAAHGMAPHN